MRKIRFLFPLVAALALLSWVMLPIAAQGQETKTRFIRDAEIEQTIRQYAKPIFGAAGLDSEAIDLYLIADDSLNAFVAGGMNMFIHTGLLQRSEGPLQVMGVIAHEAGHITGGHLANRRQKLERSTTSMIASVLLGLGAAVATGSGEVGAAVTSVGQGLTITDILSYTRNQEGAADQAAIKYMVKAGYSPEPLLRFMRIMEDQEVLLASNQDPYMRTHPLTRERIRALEEAVRKHPNLGSDAPSELNLMHRRMLAKLDGFLKKPGEVLQRYPESSDAVPDRYARAIAYYRIPELDKALETIDGLIEDDPDDPYFHELKGQMLFEHGRIDEALPAYNRAVELRPGSALLRLALAETQLQTERSELIAAALDNLEKVLEKEPQNASAWRLSAIAHGRTGKTGNAALALAEYNLIRGALKDARGQAQRAQKHLQEHSPGWLRAQDIEREAERRQEQRE